MAIGADDQILKFGAATTDLTTSSTPSAVTTGNYSVAADLDTWTAPDDSPMASFLLELVFGSAPTLGERVTLLARLMDIDGSDNDEPDVSSAGALAWGGHILGGRPLSAATTQRLILGPVRLPVWETSQVYQFYLYNGSSQTLSASTWAVYVKSVAEGPHA